MHNRSHAPATLAAAALLATAGIFTTGVRAQEPTLQPFTEASLRGGGSGVLKVVGQEAEPLRAVEIELRAGGVADITLTGVRTYRATGRWTGRGTDLVLVTDLRGDLANRPMSGQGRIHLGPNGRFARLEAEGTVDGRRFTVAFARQGILSTAPAPFRELKARKTGRGTLTIAGREAVPITEVSVFLTQTGRMEIDAKSVHNATLPFSGQWTLRTPTTAALTVTSGLEEAGARGSGTLSLHPSGASLRRVDLAGTVKGNSFRLNFAGE